MTDDQFTKLYKYMQDRDAALQSQIGTIADDMHKVIDALADIGKQYQDHQEDHALDDNRDTRLERRINELAEFVGYRFKTE